MAGDSIIDVISEEVTETSTGSNRHDILEAARRSACKLASSVLVLGGGKAACLYYENGNGQKPTLDLAPSLFPSPAEEKAAMEKHQLEVMNCTVAAKKKWLLVAELKREKQELESIIASLKSNPSIEIGQQMEQRLRSLSRLKDASIDVSMNAAKLAEAELAASKMAEHESRVMLLHAKIASVERLKKEQSRRGVGGLAVPKGTFPIVAGEVHPPLRFFCNCFQGLSAHYSACLLERGWIPYPAEAWFITAATKLQIWAPLAKSTLDYCDTASFSRYHSLLWDGVEWLEDKEKLALLLGNTQLMPPQFIVRYRAPLLGGSGDCESKRVPWTVADVLPEDVRGVPADLRAPWLASRRTFSSDAEHLSEMDPCFEPLPRKWFVKEASKNFCTGIHVCRDLAAVETTINASISDGGGSATGETWVVQEAVENQVLHADDHRCSVRVYLALVSPKDSTEVQCYTYSDGWVTKASLPIRSCRREESAHYHVESKPGTCSGMTGASGESSSWVNYDAEELDFKRCISRDRHIPLSEFPPGAVNIAYFRAALSLVCQRALPRLTVKKEVAAFELFGADFLLQAVEHDVGRVGSRVGSGAAGFRPWLCEVNRAPRQLEADRPMMHALFDIVFDEVEDRRGGCATATPQKWRDARGARRWVPLQVKVPSQSAQPPRAVRFPQASSPSQAAMVSIDGSREGSDSSCRCSTGDEKDRDIFTVMPPGSEKWIPGWPAPENNESC